MKKTDLKKSLRLFLSLVAIVCCSNIQAQKIKIYENGVLTKTYRNTPTHTVKVVIDASDDVLTNSQFSVSADKKVRFTKGNLQATYSASTQSYTWGFAENQWDYIGGKNSSGVGTETGNNTIDSQTDGAVVDLFGWSTDATKSNWGIHTQTSTSDAYTGGNFEDWGGLFPGKGYSTLSKDEWKYLLNTSNATSGARTQTNRYAKAMVNSVQGLLIFPDGYNGTTAVTGIVGIAAVNSIGASYPTTSIPTETWTTMESNDVVFLPAAGYRSGSSVFNAGSYGCYWSSTPIHSSVYSLYFDSGDVTPSSCDDRYFGMSVRLVSVASE